MQPSPTKSAAGAPVYLTATEVAGLLRVSIRTLYTYVHESRLPAPIWLGGKRLWPAQAVHDHIGAGRRRKSR